MSVVVSRPSSCSTTSPFARTCSPRASTCRGTRGSSTSLRPRRNGLPPRVDEIVEQLGLEERARHGSAELSYGDRKLVGVARALATGPSVLLLDEPAAGLNSEDSAELGVVLRRIADDLGVGILLVEHDVDLVAAVSDELVVIEFGRRDRRRVRPARCSPTPPSSRPTSARPDEVRARSAAGRRA